MFLTWSSPARTHLHPHPPCNALCQNPRARGHQAGVGVGGHALSCILPRSRADTAHCINRWTNVRLLASCATSEVRSSYHLKKSETQCGNTARLRKARATALCLPRCLGRRRYSGTSDVRTQTTAALVPKYCAPPPQPGFRTLITARRAGGLCPNTAPPQAPTHCGARGRNSVSLLIISTTRLRPLTTLAREPQRCLHDRCGLVVPTPPQHLDRPTQVQEQTEHTKHAAAEKNASAR